MMGANFVGAPAVSKENIVYIGSWGAKLHAFDYWQAKKLWEYVVPPATGSYTAKFSNPVIDVHGTIYCLYGHRCRKPGPNFQAICDLSE
jgi:outer membrane protein assembly factor BamB